jgi:hypothetical protein
MRQPSRRRRIAKWTGAVVCTLLALVTVLSLYWVVGYDGYGGAAAVGMGGITISVPDDAPNNLASTVDAPRWCVWEIPYDFHQQLQAFIRPWYTTWHVPGETVHYVPMWTPCLVLTIATVWLWHRDRRSCIIKPGHCGKCGYDLTGNVSGICPECGLKIPESEARE